MRIREFLEDHGIDADHSRSGWVHIDCPFCGGIKKGGFPADNPRFSYGFKCWKCGWHKEEEVIIELLSITHSQARKIRDLYKGMDFDFKRDHEVIRPSKKEVSFDFPPLTKECWKYLKKRGINRLIAEKFGFRFGGYFGEMAHRIVIPIYLQGKVVSYQGRDISGESPIKYKACKKVNEAMEHQKILYNLDNCKNAFVILVEGIFDAVKIGDDCAAVFGINNSSCPISQEQVELICKRFKRFAILFDNDEKKTGQIASQKLYEVLTMRGLTGTQFRLTQHDPGELSRREAKDTKHHIKEILKIDGFDPRKIRNMYETLKQQELKRIEEGW